jgi:aspartate kinase/aspartokinase/homoserine dehydrogenase 1
MKKNRVIKFGGSVLRTTSDLEKVARIADLYEQPVLIVLSAFKGVTDHLEHALSHPTNIYNSGKIVIKHLQKMKSNIIDSLFEESNLKNELKRELENRLEKLEKSLLAAHCIGEVPEFLRDDVLSYGERLSSLIVSGYLKYLGFEIDELLPEDIPLLTDGVYGNATVDSELSSVSLQERLNNRSAVIPGFYGVTQKGKKTLFGRGGSDYSAACIANCVDAESLDVWKDVNGFYSADPKRFQDAKEIKKLSYDEASEIAYFGSEILHPRTAEPLRAKGIPLNIYNFMNFQNWPEPNTHINGESTISSEIIKSIAYSDNCAYIKLSGAGIGFKGGVLAKVTEILNKNGINIKSVLTSQTAINLLFEQNDVSRAKELMEKASIKSVEEIILVDDISVIAAVGEGLIHYDGIASGIFTAVAQKEINVEMICFGASSVAAYFVVKTRQREETVEAIHNYYFNTKKRLKSEKAYSNETRKL